MSINSGLDVCDFEDDEARRRHGAASHIVSIVVPCRNEANHIESFLESLYAQEQERFTLEVIIADGMSTDGTRAKLDSQRKLHPELRVIDNPSRIVSTGLNAAIHVAHGDIIVRMDVHTEYKSDYVRRCIEALEETGADNVGGACIAVGDGCVGRAIAAAFQSAFAVGGAQWHRPSHEGPSDTVHLGTWRREIFQKVGFFDETLVRNQDDEFNLRLTRAGHKVWQSPKIVSWYHPRASLAALYRQYFQYGFWKVAVIRKHRLPASWRHVVPALFVLANLIAGLALGIGLVVGTGVWPWLTAPVIVADAIYGALNLVASAVVAMRSGWDLAPVLPIVFLLYHISYGLGFLIGLVSFFLMPRFDPSREGAFSILTR